MNSSYNICTVREGPNTVDEGHRKKLLKLHLANFFHASTDILEDFGLESSLGRYVFGSEISYNKAPPRLPGLGC